MCASERTRQREHMDMCERETTQNKIKYFVSTYRDFKKQNLNKTAELSINYTHCVFLLLRDRQGSLFVIQRYEGRVAGLSNKLYFSEP